MRAEMIEVVPFAEELGVIGRDRVDEALDLAIASARYSRYSWKELRRAA